ncbi:MAG: AraC family transcriptional regulator [Armatimonadetes bacterium]|nr:AraC family transcriptional regulator [Armatimonadota bacterium]
MRTQTRDEYITSIQRAVERICENLDSPLDIQRVASEVGFSRFHFGRIFHAFVGETPAQLAIRLKMERAADMLLGRKASVTEVAFEAGYESLEGFSRAFRSAYGMPPSEFADQRADPRIDSPNGLHWHGDRATLIGLLSRREAYIMEHRVEHYPARYYVGIRHSGAYNTIGGTFGKLFPLLGKNQLPFGMGVARFLDDPGAVAEDQLRSEACVMTAEPVRLSAEAEADGFVAGVFPEGDYLVALHKGAYSELGKAWDRFCRDVLPESGREVSDQPSFEVYLNDCSQVKEEELRTEMCFLLK